MAKSSQLLSVNVSLLKIGQNIGSREVATIPSAPQLRPGSRNSRCRAFGVGMGAPQGGQTRQSPVFPAPGRVFLKEIGMLATFISLLGSFAQAQIVWIGDVNTNFASQRVSNLGRTIGHGHFCCFFWCKQNYSKDDHSFCLPHSRLQEKPTCSQVGFLWLMQNSG